MGFIDRDTIDLGSGNKILTLSFNNPETRNSMTREMGLEFKKNYRRFARNSRTK